MRDKFLLIGTFTNTFKNDKEETVTYSKIFLQPEESPHGKISGTYIETFSIKPELVSDLVIGSTICLYYNKYGKIQEISVL